MGERRLIAFQTAVSSLASELSADTPVILRQTAVPMHRDRQTNSEQILPAPQVAETCPPASEFLPTE